MTARMVGPDGDGGAAAAPVVHLPRCDAGEPGEGGLGDIRACQERGEREAGEAAHAASIEQSSIREMPGRLGGETRLLVGLAGRPRPNRGFPPVFRPFRRLPRRS